MRKDVPSIKRPSIVNRARPSAAHKLRKASAGVTRRAKPSKFGWLCPNRNNSLAARLRYSTFPPRRISRTASECAARSRVRGTGVEGVQDSADFFLLNIQNHTARNVKITPRSSSNQPTHVPEDPIKLHLCHRIHSARFGCQFGNLANVGKRVLFGRDDTHCKGHQRRLNRATAIIGNQ